MRHTKVLAAAENYISEMRWCGVGVCATKNFIERANLFIRVAIHKFVKWNPFTILHIATSIINIWKLYAQSYMYTQRYIPELYIGNEKVRFLAKVSQPKPDKVCWLCELNFSICVLIICDTNTTPYIRPYTQRSNLYMLHGVPYL